MKELPDSIGGLRSLQVLRLRSMDAISVLPNTIGDLLSLKELQIFDCGGLTAVPDAVGDLFNLETFSCSSCRYITDLPQTFTALKALRSVNFSSLARVKALPDCTGCTFTELQIRGLRALETLPEWFGSVGGAITTLSCEDLPIKTFPPSFGTAWTSLAELAIVGCEEMVDLPPALAALVGLKMLKLQRLSISDLPSWIGGMAGLESLAVLHCPLFACLPDEIGGMPVLANVEIKNCPVLQALPATLGAAPSLETLFVKNCGSAEAPVLLPDSLAASATLAMLAYHSRNSACPAWVADLPALKQLDLPTNAANTAVLEAAEARGVMIGSFSAPRHALQRA